VEILLWLVPPAVVTVVAMLWVSWLGREGRGEVDPEVAVRRLAQALQKEHPPHAGAGPQHRDRRSAVPDAGGRPPVHGSAPTLCVTFRR
jgi:hypothetical protein